MHKEYEEPIEPRLPYLTVVYGATKRKKRPLRGDVVVVGRSPVCDLGLVSPEVAPVHCVLVRLADGWRIRDCSGRATRINGRTVHDEPLRDGDIVQVGAFSFETHLPPVKVEPESVESPGEIEIEHLKRSRRHLADLALRYRRVVRERDKEAAQMAQRESDLDQMEQRLRTLHAQAQAKLAANAEAGAGAEPPAIDDGELIARAEELEHFALHLHRQEQRLREREASMAKEIENDRADFEAELTRLRVDLEKDRRDLMELRAMVQQRQADLQEMAVQLEELLLHEREQLQRDRERITREREFLDVQRQEVIRERIALEHLQAAASQSQKPADPSTRDTWIDAQPDDRLESARRLLREMANRRKASEQAASAMQQLRQDGKYEMPEE